MFLNMATCWVITINEMVENNLIVIFESLTLIIIIINMLVKIYPLL